MKFLWNIPELDPFSYLRFLFRRAKIKTALPIIFSDKMQSMLTGSEQALDMLLERLYIYS
jgi:hypothetical protein